MKKTQQREDQAPGRYRDRLSRPLDFERVTMTTKWKVVVLFSLMLNLVCFVIIANQGESLVEAQLENLRLFSKLSADQQSLRREFNAAKATLEHGN
jgi:hypothetical protein